MNLPPLFSINSLLKLPLPELVSCANKIRKKFLGNKLEICSIVNAKSGLCSEDCKFCAQSLRHATNISTYLLKDKDEIVEAALRAEEIGAEKFGIVASGRRVTKKELEVIKQAISEIEKKAGVSVCASLGALTKEELAALKQAGLSRYHHNIETSEDFYPQVVSTHSFSERIDTIRAAQEAGLEVCSGGIIGMGESWQDRIGMACLLRELGVDSVPINLLVPLKGTPLQSQETISPSHALRSICLFRIILKDKIIKIAAGREMVLGDNQLSGFRAGANGMLIGGYLTVKGREVEVDHQLIREINALWRE